MDPVNSDRSPSHSASAIPDKSKTTIRQRKRQHIQRCQQEFERSLHVLGHLFREASSNQQPQ
ncbi:MAG: hypothetical protein EA367_17760 [Leptolyngbya sp. DLM2.Bin15]|nr:MAG: hypothetical protein EA367_17760 [Leptolyngbya sp. DLM2.Bin15]